MMCAQYSVQRIRHSHKNADITQFVLDECYSNLDKRTLFYISTDVRCIVFMYLNGGSAIRKHW